MQEQPLSLDSRRAFLSGGLAEPERPRPPGAQSEEAFRSACDGCGACIDACPESVLTIDRHGLATFDDALGACTFCGACTDSCGTGALVDDAPWPWQARVAGLCLSLVAVQCRACEDHCDERALRFLLKTGGRAVPEIDADACTGCGGCVASCPVGAISLYKPSPQLEMSTC